MPLSTSVCEDCWRLWLTLWTTSGPIPDLWQAFSSSSTNHTNHVMKYVPAIICNYLCCKHIAKASHWNCPQSTFFFSSLSSVYMKIGGICAVVATAAIAFFCLFAGLHCMMQVHDGGDGDDGEGGDCPQFQIGLRWDKLSQTAPTTTNLGRASWWS